MAMTRVKLFLVPDELIYAFASYHFGLFGTLHFRIVRGFEPAELAQTWTLPHSSAFIDRVSPCDSSVVFIFFCDCFL